ncbi:MAG: nucleotidyltransferase domain-containing protein [Microbacterium sp.]
MRTPTTSSRGRTPFGRACERYGVERLRVIGSVLTDRFDPDSSDVGLLVEFQPGRENLFRDCLDLKFELERMVGRGVDLVMERSVQNPFFQASDLGGAQDLSAA